MDSPELCKFVLHERMKPRYISWPGSFPHLCALQSFLLMHQVHGIRIECCASVPAQGTMFRFWNTIYVRSNLQIAWPYMALCDKFDLTTFSCVLFVRCMVELSYFSIFSFYNLGLMPDVAMKKTRKTPPPLWYGQQKGESSFPWHQRSKGTTAAFWNRLELRGVDANGDKSDQRDVTRCQWPQRKEKDTVHRKEMYRNVSWSRRNDVTATSKKKSWSDQNLELQSSLSHTAQSDKCNSFGGGRQSLGSIYWASRAELPGFLQLWYVDVVFRLSMQECTCPIISTKQSIWMQALVVAKVQPSSRQYTDI